MRVRILATSAVALCVLAVPQGASAEKPGEVCPPAFDHGALTVEEALGLPNIRAGLDAGEYDEAFVRAFHEWGDRNGDGLLCFQSFPSNADDASRLQYYYNVVDNNASTPNG